MRTSALLAVSVLLPVAARAQTLAQSPVEGTTLDVTAQGHVTRIPDIATIRAGVMTQAPSAVAALGENAARMTRVLAALKAAGVVARDVRTADIALTPQYRYADGQAPVVTGYQATNAVTIRFHDVVRAGAILDQLVGAGANQIDGPTLSLDKPEAALDDARTEAVRVARARAELYAKAAGLSVARIVSLAESGSNDGDQPRPPVFYARVAASTPVTTLAAGETDVSVMLSVRFLLK